MLKAIHIRIIDFFSKGHERTLLAKKNVAASFLIKGCSIGISLILVPLTIHYVNPTRYGVWLTLSSIIAWFSFFDLGLGNGLRNKLAEALASKQRELARIYVSTTYAVLSIVICGVLLLFILINPFLNWTRILNTPPEMASELSMLTLVVFVFFCIQFVLKLITTILTADQKPAMAAFLNLIGSSISLLIIFILTKTTHENLLYLGIAMSLTPVIVFFLSSLWFYTQKYKDYAPSFKFVKFSYAKSIMDLGLKFFVIQAAGIVLFSTDNIIISQLFGPYNVVPYNIAYKYFGIIAMIYSIIVTPYWSSITEAYIKEDMVWIRNSMKKLIKLTIPFFLVIIGMLLTSNVVYHYWLGNKVQVPIILSVFMTIYYIGSIYATAFTLFINGTGKIKLQFIQSVIVALCNIPITIFFANYLGVSGVILGTIICLAPTYILAPIQYYKIINNNASGIWNK